METGVYLHPEELEALPALAALGIREAVLAVSYHAGRWLTPRRDSLVRFLEDGVVHFLPRRKYGALVPQPSQAALALEPPLQRFAAASRQLRLRPVAWAVLFHNTRLGELHPEWTVRNAFGDRLRYALCPAQPEVVRYGSALLADVAEQGGVEAIELEAAGFLGYRHGSHHDKTAFGLDHDADALLSYCFCEACAGGLQRHGVDVENARQRVRRALGRLLAEGDALAPERCSLPDALPEEVRQGMLAHRLAVQRGFLQAARAAAPSPVRLLLQIEPDPWFTGSQVGQRPQALADLVDGFVMTHYTEPARQIVQRWQELEVLDRPLRLSIWPRAPQFRSDEDLQRVARAARECGAEGMRVYHAGLLPARTMQRALGVLRGCLVLLFLVAGLCAQKPRLVVLLSVDQLAEWVWRQALPFCGEDGFRRLQREGVSFADCRFRHACTATGPGHATLGTGAPARSHGIVGNEWLDPTSGETVYCVADPDQRVLAGPTAKDATDAGSGRGPGHLLAPTLAEGMRAHLGAASKVVSVAWKDRAAILMAGRVGNAVLWVDGGRGSFVSSSAYGEQLPQWVVQWNAERPFDRYYGKVWERVGPEAAYAGLVDDDKHEGKNPLGGRTLPHPITGNSKTADRAFCDHLAVSPFANDALLDVVRRAVEAEQLGADEVPDLLCVGFSCNDYIGHQYGPHSVEVRDATLRTDKQVGELLALLDEKVGRRRYLFVLTADHGIAPIPERTQAAGVPAERGRTLTTVLSAVAAADKALQARFGAPPPGGRWLQVTTTGALWLPRAETLPAGFDRAGARRIAAQALAARPGIYRAATQDEMLHGAQSPDPILRALAYAVHPQRSGDLQIVLPPYWIAGATPATHGQPFPYDSHVPLLVAGPGIVQGRTLANGVSPGVCVAIAASLLGIPRPPLCDEPLPADAFAR
jgi:hypothetical protein